MHIFLVIDFSLALACNLQLCTYQDSGRRAFYLFAPLAVVRNKFSTHSTSAFPGFHKVTLHDKPGSLTADIQTTIGSQLEPSLFPFNAPLRSFVSLKSQTRIDYFSHTIKPLKND